MRESAPIEPVSIMVFNLDAVEQTRLWLKVGPRRATEILIGALRTALLFGATVVVDRNQLLEGIFFIAVSPDRLAWHLGLEHGSELPISIRLLPSPPRTTETGDGPWALEGDRRMWGIDSTELVQKVEDNYLAVADDAKRVSSPLIALTGGYTQIVAASTVNGSVSAITAGDGWSQSDPVFLPQAVWERHDLRVSHAVRERGRRAWVDAMKAGRVTMMADATGAPNPIGPALEELRPAEGDAGDPLLAALVRALVEVEEPGRPAHVCGQQHREFSDGPVPAQPERCSRAHATARSLIVRWLDGEEVAELRPARLPVELSEHQRRTYGTAVLNWWIAAYYRAITSRDDYRMLTLFNTISTESGAGGQELAEIERTLGLRPRPLTPWRRLRSRLSRSRSSDVRIDGDIVEELAAFTPDQFVRLQRFDVVGGDHLLRDPSNRHLVDLALAVREIVGDTSSRSRRMRTSALRALFVIVPGVCLALVDQGVIELSGPAWAVTLVLVAVGLALPWDTFQHLFQMRRGSLQSTLRLRKHA